MKFEVDKLYTRPEGYYSNGGKRMRVLAITSEGRVIGETEGNTNLPFIVSDDGHWSEYVEPKQMVRYLAMRADGAIGPFRKREDAMNVGRHQLPVLSVKRVELVEGEFDE